MKILFISDIHGMSDNLHYIDTVINKQRIDKLIVLGDLYYNDEIDNEYLDIKAVELFLNKHIDKLICMRGNCDFGPKIMTSKFPICEGLSILFVDGLDIYMSHGHEYSKTKNNCFNKGILIYGHEHIPYIEKRDDMIYINAGSISLPRSESNPTYVIYENRKFTIYDIYSNIVSELIV